MLLHNLTLFVHKYKIFSHKKREKKDQLTHVSFSAKRGLFSEFH